MHISGQGCPTCRQSKGENKVEAYLIKNNINYKKQQKFKGCKNKRQLPFDFYLPDINTCIEYDGNYHITSDDTKQNDIIKTNFCIDNNINLLRFNLSNIDDIDSIINT